MATEEIPADHILFKDKPLVLGPKIGVLDVDDVICLGCYKPLSSPRSSPEDEDEDEEEEEEEEEDEAHCCT